MLQRIRTLSVQAANGTNTESDRASIQAEVTSLSKEITRIASKTTYGGKNILSKFDDSTESIVGENSKGTVTFQVGANAEDVLRLDLRLKNTDGEAVETKSYSLAEMAAAVGADGALITLTADPVVNGTKTAYSVFDVSTSGAAQTTLANIDAVINLIDSKRGDFGALENRMESTISNQTNVANNETDARSRIRDADYAEEASNLSAQSIVQQAASSMLTQANSIPQLALSLLG